MPMCGFCQADFGTYDVHCEEAGKEKQIKSACRKCLEAMGIYCEDHNAAHHVRTQPDNKDPLHACAGCKSLEISMMPEQHLDIYMSFIEKYRPQVIESALKRPFVKGEITNNEKKFVIYLLLMNATLVGQSLEYLVSCQLEGRRDAVLQ